MHIPYYLGDLYQHVLHGINLGQRLVFQDKYVGVSDSREESSNRHVEVHLSQDHLSRITSTATCGMMYALYSMHSMPSECMGVPMDGHQTGSEHIQATKLTLAMVLTMVLKVFRG